MKHVTVLGVQVGPENRSDLLLGSSDAPQAERLFSLEGDRRIATGRRPRGHRQLLWSGQARGYKNSIETLLVSVTRR